MSSRLPTAGAIPVLNEKGEMRMQKVKVIRYQTGKRPEFAAEKRDEDEEAFAKKKPEAVPVDPKMDRRLLRTEAVVTEKVPHREAEVLEEVIEDEEEPEEHVHERSSASHRLVMEEDNEDEEEDDEDAIELRRRRLREQAAQRQQEELMAVEDEQADEAEAEEEEEEEEYESDDSEDNLPAFKPVFVPKTGRDTIKERERKEAEDQRLQEDHKIRAEERKKDTHELLAQIVLQDMQGDQDEGLGALDDDDQENDEIEFEAWKVRELLRVKRDREERETRERERLEIERIRDMPEDEKQAWLEANPKMVVNKAEKGEYKFLQKYYHRGAFYLDQEVDILKRNVDQPTLEDHFDKEALPKVMQVKKFGMKGRTKYTHLTDQDTTQKEAGWTAANPVNMRFETKRGGSKDVDAPFKRMKNF